MSHTSRHAVSHIEPRVQAWLSILAITPLMNGLICSFSSRSDSKREEYDGPPEIQAEAPIEVCSFAHDKFFGC